jgi:DNA-directed RNA polymerase subunit H
LAEEKGFSILRHQLVPEHSVLSEEEQKRILEQYKITKTQLPKIFTTDPVVKALGAKAGDVLRIVRRSRTAGTAIYYRLVVKR